MTATHYLIRFPDSTPDEAGVAAERVRRLILDAQPAADLRPYRDDPAAMDGGVGLLLAIGEVSLDVGRHAVIMAAFEAVRMWYELNAMKKRVSIEPVDPPNPVS